MLSIPLLLTEMQRVQQKKILKERNNYFTNDFSCDIQIPWKIDFAVIILYAVKLL